MAEEKEYLKLSERLRRSLLPPTSWRGDDGCTAVPDMIFYPCCRQHDWLYVRGGTEEDRLRADRLLRDCMKRRAKETKNPVFRALWWMPMRHVWYLAVRAVGGKFFRYREKDLKWPRSTS